MRLSANECLKLNTSQKLNLVDHNMTAPYKIYLEVDKDDAFDYKLGRSDKFENSNYIKIIYKEVELVHRERIIFINNYFKK